MKLRLSISTRLFAAGSLTAPTPGTVVRVFAQPGDTVQAGQPLIVLEAMKMEHQVRAPAAGQLVELRVSVGQTVEQGVVLAVVDELADELADSEEAPDE